MNPSALCSDSEFQRRAYLDLVGLLPTPEGSTRFPGRSARRQASQAYRCAAGPARIRRHLGDQMGRPLQGRRKAARQDRRQGVSRLDSQEHRRQQAAQRIRPRARSPAGAAPTRSRRPIIIGPCAIRTPAPRRSPRSSSASACSAPSATIIRTTSSRRTIIISSPPSSPRVDYKIIDNKRKDKLDSHEFVGEQIVFMNDTGEVKHPVSRRGARAEIPWRRQRSSSPPRTIA